MKVIAPSLLLLCILTLFLSGCMSETGQKVKEEPIRIGIMLSDVGLGDQSFSDSAFKGLETARDQLGIVFDYRELAETGTYEEGLKELVAEDNDLIIGLGFMIKEELEKVAKEHPEQRFLLVDEVSDVENIVSLTFKEDEGSFLAGVVAGLKSETGVVGFVGGADVPLIQKFEKGFAEGVKEVNPSAEILSEYAGDFGNDQLGASIALDMIENQNADIIYTAAGFTGVGALQEAQEQGVYAIGVDSDQFFLAEEAVITSMLKNIDVAMLTVSTLLVEQGQISEDIVMGLNENGVGLAPIRVTSLDANEEKTLNELIEKLKTN
ncbi:BMP family lipoprotein [Bacillus suaedae]|uniref:BMP family ABC transporter substrate-binding protein n=1 Tax=Halalkalibacter suaedae TaxID=2822140 RepID=A0A940WYA9_9BACI|nr:BMP family ABC transporter substrate-binding protein [Bacillus suaedae]MBP3950691.1 BMP family ABC transporter substrate-binding protein [Bacillus suaedae]